MSFEEICEAMKANFEGPEYSRAIGREWSKMSLERTIRENSGKSIRESFNILLQKLQMMQKALDPNLYYDRYLYERLRDACEDIPACQNTCEKAAPTLAGLIVDLQAATANYDRKHPITPETQESMFADRRYYGRNSRYNHSRSRSHDRNNRQYDNYNHNRGRQRSRDNIDQYRSRQDSQKST
jgi:hypothetical protein